VQKADSPSRFDDLDAVPHSESSKERAAVPHPVTDLFPSKADRLNEAQIRVWSLNLAHHSAPDGVFNFLARLDCTDGLR
jgi:hypothetical protein